VTRTRWMVVTVCLAAVLWTGPEALADTVIQWDFAGGLQGWKGN